MRDSDAVEPSEHVTATLPIERLRAMLDHLPAQCWFAEPDGRITWYNKRWYDYTGTTPVEMAGDGWMRLHDPARLPLVLERWRATVAKGKGAQLMFPIKGRDGRFRTFLSQVEPIFEAGRLIGWIGTNTEEPNKLRVERHERKRAEAQVREERDRFEYALRAARMVAWEWEPAKGFVTHTSDINGNVSTEVGSIEEFRALMHPDDRERVAAAFGRAFSEGIDYNQEYRILSPERGERWVASWGRSIGGPDGKRRMSGVMADVTDRKLGELTARAADERLRLAIEGTGMATWDVDLDSMTGTWSPRRFEMFGYERPQEWATPYEEWLSRVHPDDVAMARAAAERCFEEGAPYDIAYRIQRADTGEIRWVRSYGSRIPGPDGRLTRFVGVSFDITDQKAAEDRLRVSEERLQLAQEAGGIGAYEISSKDGSAIWSKQLYALYGRDPALGTPKREEWPALIHPDDVSRVWGALPSDPKVGDTLETEFRVKIPSGDYRWLASRARVFADDDGRPTRFVGVNIDITAMKRAEEHQRLLINELNHRVKNTLAIVQGLAQQSFRDERVPPALRADFEARLAALAAAHSLLTRQNWESASLAAMLQSSIEATAGTDARRISLDGPDVPLAPQTAVAVAMAAHELATNALKHGGLSVPAGRVSVTWRVDDTGEGQRLQLEWRESGGPPVAPPERRGFGTRMIERGLSAELRGSVRMSFDPAGLVCTIDAPLPRAA